MTTKCRKDLLATRLPITDHLTVKSDLSKETFFLDPPFATCSPVYVAYAEGNLTSSYPCFERFQGPCMVTDVCHTVCTPTKGAAAHPCVPSEPPSEPPLTYLVLR